MYNDFYNSYIEIMVKREKGILEYLIIIGSILVAVILALFFILSFFMTKNIMMLVFAAAAIYLCNIIVSYQSVEYEYNLTMAELDISGIYSKKKRRRIANIKCPQIEEFDMLSKDSMEHIKNKVSGKITKAIGKDENAERYFIIYKLGEKKNALIFEPNVPMVTNIKRQLKISN